MQISPVQFTSIISHEIRTPLQQCQVLLRAIEKDQASDKDIHGLIADLRDRIKLIQFISQKAGWYAAMSTDKKVLSGITRARHLREILLSGIRLHAKASREKNLRFTLEPCELDDALVVPLDRGALEQIAFCLLDNARKYSFPNTSVATQCFSKPDGRHVVLRVTDIGLAIAPEDVDNCLKPLWRGSQAAATCPEATGFGLTIVSSILDSVGGSVALSSVDAQTTAVATIPTMGGSDT